MHDRTARRVVQDRLYSRARLARDVHCALRRAECRTSRRAQGFGCNLGFSSCFAAVLRLPAGAFRSGCHVTVTIAVLPLIDSILAFSRYILTHYTLVHDAATQQIGVHCVCMANMVTLSQHSMRSHLSIQLLHIPQPLHTLAYVHGWCKPYKVGARLSQLGSYSSPKNPCEPVAYNPVQTY